MIALKNTGSIGKLSRHRFAAFLCITLLAVVHTANAANEIVIRFSHVLSAKGNPKGIPAAAFAQRVNQELAGTVRIEVFPESQPYDDTNVFEALILGDVQMAAPSLSKFDQFTSKFRVFDLPFLFKDIDAVDRFQKSATGEELKHVMASRGIRGLAYWHNGVKQLSADRPILLPDDLQGLTFRIQTSQVLEKQYKLLGVTPRKSAFKDLYKLLESGVVNGQENTWTNIYFTKIFEIQNGITESNHGVIDYLVITSDRFWQSLPENIRDRLEKILKEITAEYNTHSAQIDAENRQLLIKSGVSIRTLSPQQREIWVNALNPVWDSFADDIGVDVLNTAIASNK